MWHSFHILNFDNAVASLLWKSLGEYLPSLHNHCFLRFPFRGHAPQKAFSFASFGVCECASSTDIGVAYV